MIASLSHVKNTLERENTYAKKKFGQNFLIDANVVDKIAKNAVIGRETVIEIGPGLGGLTEMLLKYSDLVYAYEIDKDMFDILNKEFDDERLKLCLTDFLDVDLKKVEYRESPICVCSNLPYYVTTPILFRLFESELKIDKITVMVQKEVADRFHAAVGTEDYNALSIIVQYLYDVSLLMNVPKTCFYPQPKVDSAVISFTPKRERDFEFEKDFFGFVEKCFVKRRKTLHNNLRDFLDPEKIESLYEELSLDKNIRAQQISLEGFLKIYEVLYERKSVR